MTVLTSAVKRKIIVGFAVVLPLATIALVVVCYRPIKILDARFRVISVTASRGTNQTIYLDSQLVGRVKESLRKLGLGGQPTKKVTVALRDTNYIWLSVVYAGDFAPHELEAPDAELEDSTGKVTRLQQGAFAPVEATFQADSVSVVFDGSAVRTFHPKGKSYMLAWIQPLQSTNRMSYRLRLKMAKDGKKLAEIKLGKL